MTIKLNESPGARVGLGFALAALAQLLSLFLAGAGHGWVAPLFMSAGLWFLIPLTFAVAWPTSPIEGPLLLVMGAIAVAADALLVSRSLGEISYIRHYIDVNGAIGLILIGLWLVLWLCWQAILLLSIVTRQKPAADAND